MAAEWKAPPALLANPCCCNTQARALMEPNKGVSSPAPPVQPPKSSSPPPLALAVSFFGTGVEKGIKKKKRRRESVRKWAREAEQGAWLLLSPLFRPSIGYQCYSSTTSVPSAVQACRVSFSSPPPATPPHFIFHILQLMQDVDRGDTSRSHFNYESDEEWWDSGTRLYFITVNN